MPRSHSHRVWIAKCPRKFAELSAITAGDKKNVEAFAQFLPSVSAQNSMILGLLTREHTFDFVLNTGFTPILGWGRSEPASYRNRERPETLLAAIQARSSTYLSQRYSETAWQR